MFYVLSGSFSVDIVSIDNWVSPSPDSPVDKIVLSAEDRFVLHLPSGHCTAFQALEDSSELLVFSEYPIDNPINDDYTYPLGYFVNRQE